MLLALTFLGCCYGGGTVEPRFRPDYCSTSTDNVISEIFSSHSSPSIWCKVAFLAEIGGQLGHLCPHPVSRINRLTVLPWVFLPKLLRNLRRIKKVVAFHEDGHNGTLCELYS